ncbi:hypothetical protein [Agrobacterium tumefaciens]|uniref:hypothetical protein n=1 Tax=Agrobacterium tumefaciens TaxID=358 RepID=UPI00129A84A2|nr:hypothetical protein [Agrobacterium tumefaciens]MRH96246.1 hypothetical protein [Agrobacterium tumefaciens]
MSKNYPPELLTPFDPMRRPSLAVDAKEFIKTELEKREHERRSKLELLLAHYGISKNDPQLQGKLLWALIDDHVPGFSVKDAKKRKRGKPKDTVSDKLRLISDVARLRLDAGRSVIGACRELCKAAPYLNENPASLQNRYNEARKMPFSQMLIALGLDESQPDLWSEFAESYEGNPEIEEFN